MKKYILSIDQGTTSTKAILLDKQGKIVSLAIRPVECLFPKPGWVEVDANKIWISVLDVISELFVMANSSMDEVAAISLTNQRETTVIWDRNTGLPCANAIVWQSKQTLPLCEERKEYTDFIQSKTGLRMNPYFSASKIRYLLDEIPNGQQRAEDGELCFGTIDSWIIFKLTKGEHLTDVSNASRTMLFNIFTLSWDDELLALWNIPKALLPEVRENQARFGKAAYYESDVEIAAVAGDQQSALFGQTCFDKGECKNTYGTGCFMLMNIGDKPFISSSGLLTTVAWVEEGRPTYALEGSVFMGGATVEWLLEQLRFFQKPADSEEYANKVTDTAGVYFVPSFVGMGTPWWDDEAKGAIYGLTRGVNRHHIVRAALCGIAYQSKDVIEAMKQESCLQIPSLMVDGGASANGVIMQFQSDILQCEIALPECLETTVLGVAYMAGLHIGFWKSKEELRKIHRIAKIYKPKMPIKEASALYEGWLQAIKATRTFKI